MKILVTGKSGQLARSIAQRCDASDEHEFIFAGRETFDLNHVDQIEDWVCSQSPQLIINAAAWTAVDAAEDQAEAAFLMNSEVPFQLAKSASKIGARLIHVSTDYVYDGLKEAAYIESDATNPQGVYGRSKLLGEQRIGSVFDDFVILRTAWVYGPYGSNFVKTMLKLGETRDEFNVVEDQFGNPTSSLDLADAILCIVDHWDAGRLSPTAQIYHCAGAGNTSWADFARRVFSMAQVAGNKPVTVRGIPSSEWPTKAVRPANSRLDCSKFQWDFGMQMPAWEESLQQTIHHLMQTTDQGGGSAA